MLEVQLLFIDRLIPQIIIGCKISKKFAYMQKMY